ncbi:MAG: BatD family protein [Legionellales bacterium]|nr:BatD family protein [Legionellales bacterium]
MKYVYKLVLGSICLLFNLAFAVQAPESSDPALFVTVNNNSNSIVENSAFRLNVELRNKKFKGSPDFSILQKNFRVIRSAKSESSSWINGRKSSSITWQFILMAHSEKIIKVKNPKEGQIGEIKIPKLHVADLTHKAITLKVMETADGQLDEKPALALMKPKVDNLEPLVQSMVILTIRVRLARNFEKGYMTELETKDAIVLPLGNDKLSPYNNNGARAHMFERHYAIFPQKSGKLTLTMPIFDGVFSGGSSPFGSFDDMFKINLSSMPVRETADAIILNVKEAPKEAGLQYWLPTEELIITQNWESAKKIRQGDPIVRKITVKAKGLTAEQIPNFIDYEVDGASHYTDTPKMENITDKLQVLGEKTETITYIPTADGELEFPELKVKWWDTKSKKFKITKIFGKKFNILQTSKPKVEEVEVAPVQQTTVTPQVERDADNIWKYLAIVLITLWVLTIIVIIYLKRSSSRTLKDSREKTDIKDDMSIKQLYKEIEDSCKKNLAKDTLRYILILSTKKIGVQVNSILDLKQFISSETLLALEDLEKIVYTDDVGKWKGEDLWNIIRKESFTRKDSSQEEDDDLPPLNPE